MIENRQLIVELSSDEVSLLKDQGIEHETVETENLDGKDFLTALIPILSVGGIKIVADSLLTILKKRQGSSLKINGIEVSNVSQELIEKILDEQKD